MTGAPTPRAREKPRPSREETEGFCNNSHVLAESHTLLSAIRVWPADHGRHRKRAFCAPSLPGTSYPENLPLSRHNCAPESAWFRGYPAEL